jgi:hypothetical protein
MYMITGIEITSNRFSACRWIMQMPSERFFVELGRSLPLMHTVGIALATMIANGRGTSDERMERSSHIYV